jgi:tRNA dimethylallyltransferase
MPSRVASRADTGSAAAKYGRALPPLVVICGATATGKTGLALEIADRIGGFEIVGADSRQVYRGMDVGTAKVDAAARSRIPHHGIDLAEPDESFTAADFQRHATSALQGIAARGRAALLVGGTGLYLRAIARGLPLSESGHDAAVRAALERRLADDGLEALATQLRRVAPSIAQRTDLANPRRVVRALERVELHGDRPPATPAGYPGPLLWLGLVPPAGVHPSWIADRARRQFESGLLDEAAHLLDRFPPDLPAFSAFGYREAFAVLAGRTSLDEAIDTTTIRTRAYARRQRTWFRGEAGISWIEADALAFRAARPAIGSFLAAARQPPPATDDHA